jgi:membrane protein
MLARIRARYGWVDRVVVANERYNACNGDFFAAGITYFTIFALFPLLMVGFAAAGFVLSRSPELLADTQDRIRTAVPGDSGRQLIDLMDWAIESRTSVGVIGLVLAAWAGLDWIAKLREALSEMWDQRLEPDGFVRAKLLDLAAMVSLVVPIALTICVAVAGDPAVIAHILSWVGIHDLPLLDAVLQVVSRLVAVLVSWLVFTWVIARLPRESISFASAMWAGLIAAVGFEVFKQIAAVYLRSVLTSPAGAVFGPVLGLMVFGYITARLILFATAWAATSPENLAAAPVGPPDPAVITPRVQVDEGLTTRQAVGASVVGALGALGVSRLSRRR